jgi:hypothetical protein
MGLFFVFDGMNPTFEKDREVGIYPSSIIVWLVPLLGGWLQYMVVQSKIKPWWPRGLGERVFPVAFRVSTRPPVFSNLYGGRAGLAGSKGLGVWACFK